MTKSQLIETLAKTEGITFKAAEQAVNIAFESMESALEKSDRVEIRGFGSFKVKNGGGGRRGRGGDRLRRLESRYP